MLGQLGLGRRNKSLLNLLGQLPGRLVQGLQFQQAGDLGHRRGKILGGNQGPNFLFQCRGFVSPHYGIVEKFLKRFAAEGRRHAFQHRDGPFVIAVVEPALPALQDSSVLVAPLSRSAVRRLISSVAWAAWWLSRGWVAPEMGPRSLMASS